MNVEIKEAYDRLEDVRTLFKEYTGMLGVDLGFQQYDEELRDLPGKYARPDGRLYVAVADGQAAGCIALRRLSPDTCEMKRLFVRPEFRGRKIGSLLSEQLIEDAKKIGYRQMVLDTLAGLESAVRTYKGLGFAEIPPYYDNPLEGVLYFGLDL